MAPRSPSKRWPIGLVRTEDGELIPLDLLRDILREAARGRTSNFDALIDAALECAANAHETAITNDKAHAEFVRQAQEAARQGRWELAGQLLEHQHSTEREEVQMPWPLYNIPVPASLILNEVIFRASIAQPPNLGGIIAAALRCAANTHVPAHVEGGANATPQLDQRIVEALKRAVDATTPADWIAVENELNHD